GPDLPCAHYIQTFENNNSLPLDDIYRNWWIQGHTPVPQFKAIFYEARKALNDIIDSPLITLQNPQVVRTKGRPSSTQNQLNNKRSLLL
ncbi:23073_t:CDS:2, partial [Dentiscutata erythropus]